MLDIDHAQINYPSDNFNVQGLRKLFPSEIDSCVNPDRSPKIPPSFIDDMEAILHAERIIAQYAYQRVIDPSIDRIGKDFVDASIEDLTETYIKFGIASGEHHAAQLVRHIESEAALQAARRLGRTP